MKLHRCNFLGLIILLGGCGGGSQAPTPTYHYLKAGDKAQTADYRTSVRKTANEVALDLLEANPGQNFMISPWSLHECVGMLRLGARGQTDKDFAALLHSTTPAEDAARQAKIVRSTIAEHLNSDVLRNANSLWLDDQFSPLPSFTDLCERDYGAAVNVANMPEPAMTQVNNHVNEVTRGRIPKLIENFEDESIFLVNAVSFKDRWEHEMEAQPEGAPKFFHTSGGPVTVEFVSNKKDRGAQFAYTDDETAQYLMLPYKSRFSMTLILPNEGTSPLQWIKQAKTLYPQGASFRAKRDGSVTIPKWVSTFTWDIEEYMKSKGWDAPFSPLADLTGIAPTLSEITQAVQKTFIAVDEKGTEAAAATMIGGAEGSAPMDTDPFTFVANHPFLYIIEDPAGIPYFVGVLNDPTK